MNSAIMMLREAVEKSITRNYWFLGHILSLIDDNIIERIETIRRMISAVKPFDVTCLIQYWTADFENIISPLLKIYRKDSRIQPSSRLSYYMVDCFILQNLP